MARLRKYRYFIVIILGMIAGAVLLFIAVNSHIPVFRPLIQSNLFIKGNQPTLIVGLDDNYPPYEYMENGEAKGYNIDIITAVTNAIGYQVKFVGEPWNNLLDDFNAGKIDMLSGMYISDARKATYIFSDPHSFVSAGLFSLKNSGFQSLNDLENRTVAVQAGDIMDDYLQENPHSLLILRVENPLAALEAVSDGQADAALLSSIAQGEYFLEKHQLAQVEVHTVEQPARAYAFATLKSNQTLTDQLNIGLTAIKSSGEFDAINARWFFQLQDDNHIVLLQIFFFIAIFLIILLMIGIAWNRSLKEQVMLKTSDLMQSESKFRAIFQNAIEGIIIVHQGKIVFANPKAEQILQFTDEEMSTIDIFEIAHPDDNLRLRNYYKDRLAGKPVPEQYTFRMLAKDQKERWIMNNVILTEWDNKEVLLVFFSDITQAKESETALERSKERLSLALEASNDGMWDFNILEGTTYFSPRYYAMLGYDEDEFPASFNNWIKLLHPDDRANTVKALNSLLDNPDEQPHELVFRMLAKNGSYLWILSKLKVTGHENTGIPKRISGIHTDITRQKEYEETIRKERDLLDQIMQTSNNAFLVTDSEGNVSYINSTAEKMLQVKRQDILGKNYAGIDVQITDAENTPLLSPGRLLEVIKNEQNNVYNLERILIRNQYSTHILLNAARLENADHEFDGMVVSMIDITESERVKRELIEREKRIKQIIQYSPIGIAMFDNALNLLTASEQFSKYFSIGNSETIGTSIRKLSPAIYEKWQDVFERALHGEVAENIQDKFIQKDGSTDYLRWVCCPWYTDGESIGGILFYMEIITNQVNAFQALQQSEDKFSKIFHTSPDAIYITRDSDGTYLDINQGFTTITGYERDEIIGKTSGDINGWKSMAEREEFHRQLSQDGEILNYEAAFRMKDGSIRYGLISTKTIELNHELCHIHITRDISEIREANELIMQMNLDLEDKVAERTDELERKNKELETFTYTVSHDLKAPLRGIDGYSRLLLEDYQNKLDEEGKYFLTSIQNSALHMEKLINDLLTYSRMERRAIAMKPIHLEELVNRILDEHSIERKDTDVELNLQVNQITTDYESMMQILRNLIDNAFKFARKDIRHKIEISSYLEDSLCKIKIKDNGIGFDNKYKDNIFKIFSRLHNQDEYPGTGIGLTIVKKGIERIGASISADGQVNQGAEFVIEIRNNDVQEDAEDDEPTL